MSVLLVWILLPPGTLAAHDHDLVAPMCSTQSCSCLHEYLDDPADLLTREVMEGIAARFGGGEPVERFSPMFGTYLFTWTTGHVTDERAGAQFTHEVYSQAALTGLFDRERLAEEFGVTIDGSLADFLRSSLPATDEIVYVDAVGEFAAYNRAENELAVVCDDILLTVTAEVGINDPEQSGNEQGLNVAVALARELLQTCTAGG